MGWTKQAKKDAVGKWLKFDEEHPVWTMTFLGDPKIVEKISTMGERKGEAYNAYEFPVEVEGEEKILSVTQRSLLRQLIEEEEEEPLPGRTLTIKCLDLKTKKEWKIREVKGQLASFEDKKQVETEKEEEKEPEAIPEADDQDKKAKEKFKKEVAKRAKKVKAQEEADKEAEANARTE